MHPWSLSALLFTVTFGSITSATPIIKSQFLARNHVECDSTNHLCQIQQTCDNAPSIVAGTVPVPWPSSVAQLVNPITALEPSNDGAGASGTSTSRKRISRQPTTVQWCALGTEVYILLAIQGTQSAAEIKSTLGTAVQQVQSQMVLQTAKESETGIAAGSAPVYSLAGTDAKLTASNAAGATMTWLELEVGLLTISDWMAQNTYGWGSASVWNGTDEVGMIYITV